MFRSWFCFLRWPLKLPSLRQHIAQNGTFNTKKRHHSFTLVKMELPWEKTNNWPGLTRFQFSLLNGLLATMYPRSSGFMISAKLIVRYWPRSLTTLYGAWRNKKCSPTCPDRSWYANRCLPLLKIRFSVPNRFISCNFSCKRLKPFSPVNWISRWLSHDNKLQKTSSESVSPIGLNFVEGKLSWPGSMVPLWAKTHVFWSNLR